MLYELLRVAASAGPQSFPSEDILCSLNLKLVNLDCIVGSE